MKDEELLERARKIARSLGGYKPDYEIPNSVTAVWLEVALWHARAWRKVWTEVRHQEKRIEEQQQGSLELKRFLGE